MYSIDVKSLKLGAVAVDGGMGTVLTSPGGVRENTLKLNPSDDTITAFMVIGQGNPAITSITKGVTNFEYDLMIFDLEVLADLTGGELIGVAPNEFWHEPALPPVIIRSHEIVDGQGMTWQIPAGQISAKLVGAFSKTDPNVIRVKGTVLQPEKEGIGALAYGKKA